MSNGDVWEGVGVAQGVMGGTTLLRRQIGRKFEELRKAAGMTMEDAAIRLEKARATLHRIENGAATVRFRNADVEQMLQLYNASPKDAELLRAMTAETRHSKSWWHDYAGSALPSWFQLYLGLEEAAAMIRQYEAELVPGLLQVRAYADEVFRIPYGAATLDHGEQTRRVQVRMERQSLLTRFASPLYHVVLNEAVLRRLVGSPSVMVEQLGHLLKAGELENVTVQVLPFRAGMHAGAMTGTFSILNFPASNNGQAVEPPVAYAEAGTGALYLDKPREVQAYDTVWADMTGRALSELESRGFIAQIAEEFSDA